MGIGQGLIEGVPTDDLSDITPDGDAYVSHSGAVFHPQDESGGGSVPFYEIQNPSDSIRFTLQTAGVGSGTTIMLVRTVFGPTDFDVQDANSGDTIVSEQSGFDTGTWFVNLDGTTGEYIITNFDTGNGVDGTQAGWYPYVAALELQTR